MRDYSNSGESTSVSCHQIEDDLQTQGMTVSCTSALTQQLASSVKNSKKGSYVVREIHEDSTDWHKKARLQFARTCQNTYGRMSWGQMGKRTISIFTENKIKPSNKRTPSLQLNMEVVQWCFVIVCCLCHWVPSMCAGLEFLCGIFAGISIHSHRFCAHIAGNSHKPFSLKDDRDSQMMECFIYTCF